MSKIYAIADLHLSFDEMQKETKPMNIFGDKWENHSLKISKNWKDTVKKEDYVIIPGDISWAMDLNETYQDFKYINDLPGTKIFLKGNHDYWWDTKAKIEKYLKQNNFDTIKILHNNSYILQNEKEKNIGIVGTRLWQEQCEEDKKIINRENCRLELSICDCLKKAEERKEEIQLISFFHYMPISKENIRNNKLNETLKILLKYNIKKVYYGHLHGQGILDKIEGNYFGIDFKLISSDNLDFMPYLIS